MQDERPDVDEVAGGKGEEAGAVDELKVLESPDLVPDRLFHDIDDVERRGLLEKGQFPALATGKARGPRPKQVLADALAAPVAGTEPMPVPTQSHGGLEVCVSERIGIFLLRTSSSHFPSSGHRCLMLCRIFSRSSE